MFTPDCLDVGFTPPEIVLSETVLDWVLQILCQYVGFTPPELVLPKNVQIWVLQKQCLDVGFTPPEIVLSEQDSSQVGLAPPEV